VSSIILHSVTYIRTWNESCLRSIIAKEKLFFNYRSHNSILIVGEGYERCSTPRPILGLASQLGIWWKTLGLVCIFGFFWVFCLRFCYTNIAILCVMNSILSCLILIVKSRRHEIVRAQKKVCKGRPKALPKIMSCSHGSLECIVMSYVTEPSTKCYFNEFLSMRVLTRGKI
jgi:hypothetical protein